MKWYETLDNSHQQRLFSAMRRCREKADYYRELERKLTPPAGSIPVGSEWDRAALRGQALSKLLSRIGAGDDPSAACEAAKLDAREYVKHHNQRWRKDYQLQIADCIADAELEHWMRVFLKATEGAE